MDIGRAGRARWNANSSSTVTHRPCAPPPPLHTIHAQLQRRRHGVDHGVDMSTPLLLEVAPEIDTNPTSFYRGRGRGVSPWTPLGAPPPDPR